MSLKALRFLLFRGASRFARFFRSSVGLFRALFRAFPGGSLFGRAHGGIESIPVLLPQGFETIAKLGCSLELQIFGRFGDVVP